MCCFYVYNDTLRSSCMWWSHTLMSARRYEKKSTLIPSVCTLRCGRYMFAKSPCILNLRHDTCSKSSHANIFIWNIFFNGTFTLFSPPIPIVLRKKAHHSRRLSNLFTSLCGIVAPTHSFYTFVYRYLCVCTTHKVPYVKKKKKWSWMEKYCVTRFKYTFHTLFRHIFRR